MAISNRKNPFASGIGTARYAWIHPDRPDTEFNADGEYKLQLIMDPKAAEKIMAVVDRVVADAFPGEDPSTLSIPIDTEEETGNVILKMKTKFPPKYTDAAGSPIVGKDIPNVWGGSTLQAYGNVKAYEVNKNQRGISLQLNTVQVIALVEGRKPAGFEAVEGYTASSSHENEEDDMPDAAEAAAAQSSSKKPEPISDDAINF